MGRFLAAVAALIILGAVAGRATAEPERRVALVIGESAYAGANRLPNPVKDASLVSEALTKAGFQTVVVRPNIGYDAFVATLRDFERLARGAEVAFVYYAGHGIQSTGPNWLIPIDAALSSENDLNLQAISLDQVLAATDGAKWKLVALDACRDSPFVHAWRSSSRGYHAAGLAPVDAENVVVMYATAENQAAQDGPEGSDSPFAKALAKALDERGLEIHRFGSRVREEVMAAAPNQRPFYTDSISNDTFYLLGPVKVTVAPAPTFDPREADLAFWNSVGQSNDPAQLKAYLAQFPNGLFAGAARAKIASLTRPAEPPGTGRAFTTPGLPASHQPRAALAAARLPTEFVWYYQFENSGSRDWKQVGPKAWLEILGSGGQTRFTVVSNDSVLGCNGEILRREDNNLEAFIPDDHCALQSALFRNLVGGKVVDAQWHVLGRMMNTVYPTLPR